LAAIAEAEAAGARLGAACEAAGLSIRTVERWRARPDGEDRRMGPHQRPHNALTDGERAGVIEMLSRRGLSPRQLVPRLADEGIYVASESTMYRIARSSGLRHHRRPAVRTYVTRATTAHQASRPNQVWSWDITYLPSLVRGRFFYLYLVMDVWSRRIVGWTVETRETPEASSSLIRGICDQSRIDPRGLVLHSDNGQAMRGNTMLATLRWLGVVPSFSRPHVSNDNPYSEALFRTLKYGPSYPSLPFADLEEARRWVARFVAWYNREHRHSGIRYVTPDERHFGRETNLLAQRHTLYQRARHRRPERWSRHTRNWNPVGEVSLNPEPASEPAIARKRQLS
jgi:putative transposase